VIESRFFDCVVATTNYWGYSWFMSPHSQLNDGYLDVTLFEMTSRKYRRVFPLIYFGRYQKRLPHFKARRVIITGAASPFSTTGNISALATGSSSASCPRLSPSSVRRPRAAGAFLSAERPVVAAAAKRPAPVRTRGMRIAPL